MTKSPEIRRIKDPIADDYWAYSTADGDRKTSRVTIGRPLLWPRDAQGDWLCPVRIEDFTHGIATLAGVGPVDALLNAMRVVQAFADQIGAFTPRAREKVKTDGPRRLQARQRKARSPDGIKANKRSD